MHYLKRVTDPWEEDPGDTSDKGIPCEKVNRTHWRGLPSQARSQGGRQLFALVTLSQS